MILFPSRYNITLNSPLSPNSLGNRLPVTNKVIKFDNLSIIRPRIKLDTAIGMRDKKEITRRLYQQWSMIGASLDLLE
jgi:hypothetical protein